MTPDNDFPALARLKDQLGFYDRKSVYNQKMYKLLKLWTILVAALVPVSVAAGVTDVRTMAIFTASIAVAEAIQQMNQYQTTWITYRSTAEALKHELYLYLSSAGPYASSPDPKVLLAERVEALVSQENAKWSMNQEQMIQSGKRENSASAAAGAQG
jgi:hypothetical protein